MNTSTWTGCFEQLFGAGLTWIRQLKRHFFTVVGGGLGVLFEGAMLGVLGIYCGYGLDCLLAGRDVWRGPNDARPSSGLQPDLTRGQVFLVYAPQLIFIVFFLYYAGLYLLALVAFPSFTSWILTTNGWLADQGLMGHLSPLVETAFRAHAEEITAFADHAYVVGLLGGLLILPFSVLSFAAFRAQFERPSAASQDLDRTRDLRRGLWFFLGIGLFSLLYIVLLEGLYVEFIDPNHYQVVSYRGLFMLMLATALVWLPPLAFTSLGRGSEPAS